MVESETTLDLPHAIRNIYFQKAFLAALVGLCSFNVGYYFTNNRIKLPSFILTKWRKKNILFVCVSYFIVGFASFFLLIQKGGGFKKFIQDIESFRAGGLIGQGILMYPATRLLTIATLIYFISKILLTKRQKPFMVKGIFIVVLSVLPASMLGFRALVLLPFINYFIVYHLLYKKVKLKTLFIMAILFISSFTFLGIYRTIPPGVNLNFEQILSVVEKKPELAYAVLSRSKGTEVVASVIRKLEETGDYELGYKSLLEAATIYIPRSIWENKPEPSSVRFTTYFFGSSFNYTRGIARDDWGGVSPTIIGELFWNYGWLGVIIGMYLFGVFTKIFYKSFITNINYPSVIFIYALLFTTLFMFAEAIQGNLNGLVMDLIVIMITIFLLKVKIKKTI